MDAPDDARGASKHPVYSPHPLRRFWLYDPVGHGMMYFENQEDRDAAADRVIKTYLDDGWDESVEDVAAGELTHRAKWCGQDRPPDDQLDDELRDSEGIYWGDFRRIGVYTLAPLDEFKL